MFQSRCGPPGLLKPDGVIDGPPPLPPASAKVQTPSNNAPAATNARWTLRITLVLHFQQPGRPRTPTERLDWKPQCGRIPEVCSYPLHFPANRCGITTAMLDAPKFRNVASEAPRQGRSVVRSGGLADM